MNNQEPLKTQAAGYWFKHAVSQLIFASRWLQLPLYIGLIFILAVYVYRFSWELYEIATHVHILTDSDLMLAVLDLIDAVMLANLLIMVLMGGYDIFVSNLGLMDHPDKPEWLDHIDAGSMKIKLAVSLVGISSIHLLRTFIAPNHQSSEAVMWQVLIHLTLLVSAIVIAFTDRLLAKK